MTNRKYSEFVENSDIEFLETSQQDEEQELFSDLGLRRNYYFNYSLMDNLINLLMKNSIHRRTTLAIEIFCLHMMKTWI